MRASALRWYAKLRLVPECDGVIVARDCRGGEGEKEYARVGGPSHVLELAKAARGRGAAFYEHCDDGPCTVYFDIDKRGEHDAAAAREILAQNTAWIAELLRDLGHACRAESFRVLECCRAGKVSFHILVRSCFVSGDAGRKGLQRAIKNKLRVSDSDVDPAPYGRNALFRTIYSSKLGTGVPLVPLEASGAAFDETDYLVRDVCDSAAMLEFDEPCAAPRVARAPRAVVAGGAEAAYVEQVTRAVRDAGDATSVYRPEYGDGRYYFQTQGRRTCLASGATHTSNNFVVVVAPDGGVVYQCLSARCGRETRVIGRIAQAPPVDWEARVATERYAETRTRAFAPGIGITLVRAAMGTGKTYQLREYVRSMRDARVLVVSFRVSLCRYLHEYLGDFEMYSETAEPAACARLIVTVNSLWKLRGAEYDVLVLDESESIMEQFDAVHPSHQKLAWLVFDMLVRSTPRVICLDASLGPRTYNVMRSVRDEIALVVNEHRGAEHRTVVVERRDRFLTSLCEALRGGARVAVASTSATQLVAVHAAFQRHFPDKAFYLIHAGTSEHEKVAFARHCNVFLPRYDALFYSPTIQAGNSIDVPFDAMFVYATPCGPTPEGVHQMIGRVRTLRSARVTVTFDCTPTGESREYSYEEMAQHLTTPLTEHAAMCGLATRFTDDWTLDLERSALFVLTVWNMVYRVNGHQNFAPRFLRLCDAKGYEVRAVVPSEEGDVRFGAGLRQEAHAATVASREEHLAAVVDARKLDATAYARLRQDLRIPTAERETALAVERYEFCQCYNIDEDALTVETLRRYARPARRCAYHRLCLMLPPAGRDRVSVAARIDDVLRAEGSLIELSGPDHVFAAVHLPRTSGVRLRYAHQLFVDLGFESAFDTSRVAAPAMDVNARAVRALLAEHRANIDTVFLTPCAARRREAPVAEWSTQETVRYVNGCVRELLGVYVRRTKHGYQLVGSGNWDFGQQPARRRVPLRSADLTDWTIFGA